MSLLSKEVAVITGGSSGIGRAIARAFAERGADVVIADIREQPRGGDTPTADYIAAETDSRATFVECDVTDVSDLEAAVSVADEFGGISCLVNSAGVIADTAFFDSTEAEYERVFDVNVKGTYFASQIAAEKMVDRGSGTIITISSTAGLRGSLTSAVYSASKGAVRLLTYALAAQLGPAGVRVNAIHPGTIRTSMVMEDLGAVKRLDDDEHLAVFLEDIPSRRIGEPTDVANAAVFLASDLSGYVNAESLVVDGGRTNTY